MGEIMNFAGESTTILKKSHQMNIPSFGFTIEQPDSSSKKFSNFYLVDWN